MSDWSDPASDPMADLVCWANAVDPRLMRLPLFADLCSRSGSYLDDLLDDRYHWVPGGVGEATCGECGARMRTFTRANEAIRLPAHMPAASR